MNRFKTKLVGFGIAAGLLALPLSVGAASAGEYSNHRHFTAEVAGRAQYDPTAHYMMIERSPLEEIAGRDNLDWQTIKFLEDNLWDHDIRAYGAGEADEDRLTAEELQFLEENLWGHGPTAEFQATDDTEIGVYDIDPDRFSEEIFWQDEFEDSAEFAILVEPDNYYPSPDDVPQLRAGELNY